MSLAQQFGSDNYAGICPEAWAAMQEANQGHAPAYGDDAWTTAAADAFRALFETDCEVFFTFNGTAANSLALASLCQSFHSVICSEIAHIETDECGAPEFFSNGSKLILVPARNGKLDAAGVRAAATRRDDLHFPKPRVVSITQATENGTLYRLAEIAAIGDVCRSLGLHLHMDGARFANACANLNCTPAEMTWRAGVDVLCFGGTKNGMAIGEAVVFFRKELARDFEFRCKQAGQLASKMRFLAAPWVGVLQDDAWLRHARHANACARRLAQALEGVSGIRQLFPVEANGVFIDFPPDALAALRARGWRFYTFIGEGGARFMCAWDTEPERVDALAADIRAVMAERSATPAVVAGA